MATANAHRNGTEVHHDDQRDGSLLADLSGLVSPLAGCRIVSLRAHRLAIAFPAGELGMESRFADRGPGHLRARRRQMVCIARPRRTPLAGRPGSLRGTGTGKRDSVAVG